MARLFKYHELIRGFPAPATDILRVAETISELAPFRQGHAVLGGSAAWGSVSRGSDIDVFAYSCKATENLEREIGDAREAYAKATDRRHDPPKVDIVLLGAEKEELVERDNLVSNSSPILEPRVVSEIFERVGVRVVDHLKALGSAKGNPWRAFTERYVKRQDPDNAIRRDVLREYSTGAAKRWRLESWNQGNPAAELSDGQLEALGHADSFGHHLARFLLSDLGAYPIPDRRSDIRAAIGSLSAPWSGELQQILAPFFALGEQNAELVRAIESGREVPTEQNYYVALRECGGKIDFGSVEEFVWRYVAA